MEIMNIETVGASRFWRALALLGAFAVFVISLNWFIQEGTYESQVAVITSLMSGLGVLLYVLSKRTRQQVAIQTNREKLLSVVNRSWVETVLGKSTRTNELINLSLSRVQDAVPSQILKTQQYQFQDILGVYQEAENRLLILGTKGSGKTTLLLTLTKNLTERAATDISERIPIPLNISSWRPEFPTFDEWLTHELNTTYQIPIHLARDLVGFEKLNLMLDGLDEVPAELRSDLITSINEFLKQHRFVGLVVCSRINDYYSVGHQLNLKGAIVLDPLSPNQIEDFVAREDLMSLWETVELDQEMREMASVPFLLNAMALAYRNLPTNAVLFVQTPSREERLKHLFEKYLSRMFSVDTDNLEFPPSATYSYLRWIAHHLRAEGRTVFYIDEIQILHAGKSIKTNVFAFWVFITLLFPTLVFSVGVFVLAEAFVSPTQALATGVSIFLCSFTTQHLLNSAMYKIPDSLLFGFVFGLSFGLFATLFLSGIGSFLLAILFGVGSACYWYFLAEKLAGNPNKKRKDWATIFFVEGLKWSWRNLVVTMSIGLFIYAFFLIAFNFLAPSILESYQLQSSTTIIFIGILIFISIANGLIGKEVVPDVRPNGRFIQSVRNGLKVFIAVFSVIFAYLSLTLTLVLKLENSWAASLLLASGSALMLAWGFGIFPCIQHWYVRIILAKKRLLPVRLTHFLQHACNLSVLRRLGSGYSFQHEYLAEYFETLV